MQCTTWQCTSYYKTIIHSVYFQQLRSHDIYSVQTIFMHPSVCKYIYIYISGEEWLGNQVMQSIMQGNHQGGESKGEPYTARQKKYSLPLHHLQMWYELIFIWENILLLTESASDLIPLFTRLEFLSSHPIINTLAMMMMTTIGYKKN